MNNEQITPMTIKESKPQAPLINDPQNHFDWTVIFYVILAFIAGFIKYIYDVRLKKHVISYFDAIIHASVSALSGYVMYQICLYLVVPASLIGAVVGVSGWAGIAVIKKFEKILNDGLGDRLKQALLTFIDNDKK